MKSLIIGVLSVLLCQAAFAYDTANMRFNIHGNTKASFYICLNSSGCFNLAAGDRGKTYKIDTTTVEYISMADVSNRKMSVQNLPESCKVNVSKDQTFTVSGTLVKAGNDQMRISNLRCTVA